MAGHPVCHPGFSLLRNPELDGSPGHFLVRHLHAAGSYFAWVYEITPAGIKQAEHFCDALHASKESLVRRKQVVLWIALAFRFLYFLVFGHCVFNGLKSEGEKSVKINR